MTPTPKANQSKIEEQIEEIINRGVPASVRSTWKITYLDGKGADKVEPAKPPEYAAKHFHKFWTPQILALIKEAERRGRIDELKGLEKYAQARNSIQTTTYAWQRLAALEKQSKSGEPEGNVDE